MNPKVGMKERIGKFSLKIMLMVLLFTGVVC
jgi:hypothetical protein